MIGKLLDHRYQVIRVLATGGFGQTYIAQDTRRPGNPICVVKHLKPSNGSKIFDTAKRLFNSEAETLEKLGNHDQIPRLLAYFDENHEFYLVQEFIEGHPLSDELVPGHQWSESQVIHLLQEILTILEFVHSQGVIHRDIKPDNIIRRASDNKLVLVDFGAVKQLRSTYHSLSGQATATVAIGTPGYMPTEQGQGKPRPNSDIYALGIIAVQAITGVAPVDLQEDPNTGEILWHLAPVSHELADIIDRMVRYHFKDRYQTATEALQSLKLLSPLRGEYSQIPTQVTKSSSPQTGQRTVAVAPRSYPPVNKPSKKVSNNTPDFMPLLVGVFLAGSATALVANLSPSVKSFNFNFASSKALETNCLVEVLGKSNIRSEPDPLNSENVVEITTKNTKFDATGKRTRSGWVQLKLDNGNLAWAHPNIIANNNQWVTCLRDKNVAVKTVEDHDYIANVPIYKPKTIVIVTPSPSPKPQDENAAKILEKARKKYESGDLNGAIALLKSVTTNASEIKQTGEMITQWQKDWAKAEALSTEINKAIDEGKWDKVLAYKDQPEKLPNIQYWRNKLEPLFKQADDNVKQTTSKQPSSIRQRGSSQEP
jgi:serine/threonine-protein kinase